VEITVSGLPGVYLPLLNPASPSRHGEYELPGGGIEADTVGSQQSALRIADHLTNFVAEDDLLDGPASESAIRDNFARLVAAEEARAQEWRTTQMLDEVSQETGLGQPAVIQTLPFDADGRVTSKSLVVTGGKGKQLVLALSPHLLRYTLPALPALTLSREHTHSIYLYFPGWGPDHRQQVRAFNSQLRAATLSLAPRADNIFTVPVLPGPDVPGIRLSSVTSRVLDRYFQASFADLI